MSRFHTMKRGAMGLVLLFGLTACDSLLEVTNPATMPDEQVGDSVPVNVMAATAINEFQRDFSWIAWAGAIISDEAVNGHNFSQWRDMDLRFVEDNNTQLREVYLVLQRARATGDRMAGYIRERVADPTQSMDLATALTYSGYAHIYLAEYFCFAPMGPTEPAIRSADIHARAVERFTEAIAIASQRTDTASQRILNLARVGAARASLQQNKLADAIAFASAVPAGFVTWVNHAESPTNLRNYMVTATTGTNRNIGVDPSFRGLNDRRVRHNATAQPAHNTTVTVFVPFQSASYSGWSAEGGNELFRNTTGIRLASGLEARHILAEAGHMSETELRAFINERRAVGGQPLIAAETVMTEAQLKAELRDQRRRDFFLDGHRLGDIRRYRTHHTVDFFPTGPHPFAAVGWGEYDTATCLIPHENERIGNPNYQPLSPLDP